jgi:NADH-quinone oxidoreductase subunit M
MVGVFALTRQSLEGAILQMVNHGISTGALFLLIGMIYERRHTRMISDFGGLAKVMPFFAFSLTVVALIGLPGTNGFVGEFLILIGTFQRFPVVAMLATTGVIFAAAYMLPMLQRVILNPLSRDENRELKDLNRRERWIVAPLLGLILLIGVYPQPFLDRMSASVDALMERVEFGAQQMQASESSPDPRLVDGHDAELRFDATPSVEQSAPAEGSAGP